MLTDILYKTKIFQDGTLLTTDKRVSNVNQEAIRRVLSETDVLFVPATGKSRAGAINSMGELGKLLVSRYPKGCPGVYLQGLIVYDVDGSIIYENQVDSELGEKSVALAQQLCVDIIAYSRDAILSDRSTDFTDLLPKYREPEVTVIPSWEQVIGKRTLNKFIMMAHPDKIDEIRPSVQAQLGTIAHLTQAQPDMLEILPPLSSKGDGVRRLLDRLSVDPKNVLAVGDAENDIELLKMVEYSCAMGNALPSVKDVAKYTDFSSNDDDGVAEVVDRFFVHASVGSL